MIGSLWYSERRISKLSEERQNRAKRTTTTTTTKKVDNQLRTDSG